MVHVLYSSHNVNLVNQENSKRHLQLMQVTVLVHMPVARSFPKCQVAAKQRIYRAVYGPSIQVLPELLPKTLLRCIHVEQDNTWVDSLDNLLERIMIQVVHMANVDHRANREVGHNESPPVVLGQDSPENRDVYYYDYVLFKTHTHTHARE